MVDVVPEWIQVNTQAVKITFTLDQAFENEIPAVLESYCLLGESPRNLPENRVIPHEVPDQRG
ncbi:hypothetical protein D3C84_1240430 [compost metagenome]